MADEAFALSPISARATQPREEDYEAIRDAFMETSRGRWFLGEYARRNRNADTSMVLDAVARIEESLAAQRQPASDGKLAEALAALQRAVDEARDAAATALDGLALEEALAPVRKGTRVIREISWRWREIGADGRICDLIDSQVSAIEAGCGQLASAIPKTAVDAAFVSIERKIGEFGESDTASREAAKRSSASDEAPPAEIAEDEAVLDMIALEMGAADPFDIDEPPLPDEALSRRAAARLHPRRSRRCRSRSPRQHRHRYNRRRSHRLVRRSSPTVSCDGPLHSATDPLAPLRRMSQAERVAFFS